VKVVNLDCLFCWWRARVCVRSSWVPAAVRLVVLVFVARLIDFNCRFWLSLFVTWTHLNYALRVHCTDCSYSIMCLIHMGLHIAHCTLSFCLSLCLSVCYPWCTYYRESQRSHSQFGDSILSSLIDVCKKKLITVKISRLRDERLCFLISHEYSKTEYHKV